MQFTSLPLVRPGLPQSALIPALSYSRARAGSLCPPGGLCSAAGSPPFSTPSAGHTTLCPGAAARLTSPGSASASANCACQTENSASKPSSVPSPWEIIPESSVRKGPLALWNAKNRGDPLSSAKIRARHHAEYRACSVEFSEQTLEVGIILWLQKTVRLNNLSRVSELVIG